LEKEESKGDLAPRLTPAEALALRLAVKQGHHPVDLPVEISGRSGPMAATYRTIDWTAIDTPDSALANQRAELRAALGSAQHTAMLADGGPETHVGIRLYRPGTDDGSVWGVLRHYTKAERQYEEAIKANNGREAESSYLVRGIYRSDLAPNSRQKA